MKPIQLLIKPASFDCNLQCDYCFYLRVCKVYDQVKHPRMSLEVLERLIAQFLGYQFKESIFGWQGGEPTLMGLDFFKKVVELQQKHGKTGQIIGNALQTNGILIDSEWARFLHEYRFLIGLSLDGPKDVHDRYRKTKGGKSVWHRVMNAAEVMQAHQVEFNVLCVVSKANVNRATAVYDFFLENGFRFLQFIPALEADKKGKLAPFSVNPRQYGKFLCELFDAWSKNPREASIRIFDSIISHHLGYPKGFCAFEEKCADYLLVEHNGDVYPCDFFVQDKYKLGNLCEEDLSVLKQKRDNDFGRLKPQLSEDCMSCKWLTWCHGGCIKDRIFSDNPHPKKTYYCASFQRLFKHSEKWFAEFCESLKKQ